MKSTFNNLDTWCCKANDKVNLPYLETKKGELCSYLFKCSNCQDNYQANSNQCPFWKHWFNWDWYNKNKSKYMKTGTN